MEIDVTQNGARVDFSVSGNIGEQEAEVLKQQFQQLNLTTTKEVVFDFRQVRHIGSSGIGKLLLFYKDLAANQGILRIENLSERLYEMFKLLKLDSIFSLTRV